MIIHSIVLVSFQVKRDGFLPKKRRLEGLGASIYIPRSQQ